MTAKIQIRKSLFETPVFLLVTGAILTVAAGMRWNVSVAGWLFPLPFLMYMRLGLSRKWLLVTLLAACILQVSKIVSEPMFAFIALAAGLQAGIFFWLIFLGKEWIRKTRGEFISVMFFASAVTVMEYISELTSPLGVWGMQANTQIDNLQILQVASVTGAYGISFLMIWFSGLAESLIYKARHGGISKDQLKHAAVFSLAMFAVYLYGGIRVDLIPEGKTIEVATVSSKKFGVGDVMSSENSRFENNRDVLRMIRKSLNGPPENRPALVITNEGALFIKPDELELTIGELRQIARESRSNIVAGYIIYKGAKNKFQNKAIWIDDSGEIRQDYFKQFVPPGEPSEKIDSEIKSIDVALGSIPAAKAAIAICYDFDSAPLTMKLARSGAGLVAIPSSDWKGIDPVHTKMTRLRAIEGGYSVIRSTRAAISGAYDAFGRTRAFAGWYEDNSGIMTAIIPVEPVWTFYKFAGDWFAWLNIILLVFSVSGWSWKPGLFMKYQNQ